MSRGAGRRPGLAAALAAALLAAALAATAASGAYGVAGAAAAEAAAATAATRRGSGGSFFLGGSSSSSFFDDDGEEGGSSTETATTSPYIVELVPGSDDADVTSLCERLEAGQVGTGNGNGNGKNSSTSTSTSSSSKGARCGRHLYRSVFCGALVHAPPGVAAALGREPGVASVHPDDLVTLHSDFGDRERRGAAAAAAETNLLLFSSSSSSSSTSFYPQTQLDAPWHLARLSSPEPLSKRKRSSGKGEQTFSLEFSAAGTGATVFVVDTGVYVGHAEFRWSPTLAPFLSSSTSSSASRVRRGFSVFESAGHGAASSDAPSSPASLSSSSSSEDEGVDCVGHGTHVAALAAGLTFGLAKNATIVPVRVVGCDGAAAVSDVVAGLDWISSVLLLPGSAAGGGDDDSGGSSSSSSSKSYSLPAVVSLSVGSSRPSPALERAAQALVDLGALVVAAAGNAGADACGASPGRLPSAITVGASDALDGVWDSSNFGPCVDLHAPGVNVTSATSMRSGIEGGERDGEGGVGAPPFSAATTSTAVASGTSMAAPVVSGAAAVFLEAWPGATPSEVHDWIVSSAAKGVLRWGRRRGDNDAAAAASASAAEANTANLLLQAPPPPRPSLVVAPSALPPAILFEPAPPGGGREEEKEDGEEGEKQRGVSKQRLVLSLPPSPSSSNLVEEEAPFEVKVDFFAGGAPAGWLTASPASGVLTKANPTAKIELVFDASAAAGFFSLSSSSSSLWADVVVTSRSKLAARRRASARVFCSRLALTPRGGAHRVTRMEFLEAWDEAAGPPRKRELRGGGGNGGGAGSFSPSSSSSSSYASSPWVSATLAVALSHPVAANSLPEGSFVVNGGVGEVVSIAQGGGAEKEAEAEGGGRSCSEWIVRVRAPASSSSSSSSFPSARLCVSLSPRGVFDVWGAPFGAAEKQPENCTEVRLAPRLRLFAPFAAAAAPAEVVSSSSSGSSSNLLSVEAEVGASEEGRVLLLVAASEPVRGLDASSFDVAIDGGSSGRGGTGGEKERRAGVVALSPVVVAEGETGKEKAAATLWHAVLQLPAGYLGPIVVSLRTQGIRSLASAGESGARGAAAASAAASAAAAPSAPLALRAVAAPLFRPIGFSLS